MVLVVEKIILNAIISRETHFSNDCADLLSNHSKISLVKDWNLMFPLGIEPEKSKLDRSNADG
jgi:hypothetical protein